MISNQIVKTRYIGNGITRTFPINFAYTDQSQVKLLIAIDQEETIISPNDYNITGGNVIYPANQERQPAAAGTVVLVYRETPQTQETDFTNQGGAWPETIEKSLDKLTQEVQEISEAVDRCVMVNKGDDITPGEIIASIKQSASDAESHASAAAQSASDAELHASAAAQSASSADTDAAFVAASIDRVERIEADLEAASKYLGARATVYDPNKQYIAADVVMTPDGSVYRCIIPSRGEDPAMSSKWQRITCCTNDTFEIDDNGDYMPRSAPATSTLWETDENGDIKAIA